MAKFQRLCVFLLILPLIFALAACKAEDPTPTEAPTTPENMTVYTATGYWSGDSYTVDKEKCTITDGKYTYKYKLEGTDPNYRITVIYPNGHDGVWLCRENGGSGGGFTGGLGTDYADIADLADVVVQGAPKAPKPVEPEKPKPRKPDGYYIAAFFILILGILYTAAPRALHRARYWCVVTDPEPTAFAIIMNRVIGIVMILSSIVIFFT